MMQVKKKNSNIVFLFFALMAIANDISPVSIDAIVVIIIVVVVVVVLKGIRI